MRSDEVRRQNRAAAAAGRAQGELFRLRVAYEKGERLAYLGHLEMLNTALASVRRSGIPFAVGNGFTRRVRVQFSQALPVGASSAAEYYDVMLTERADPAEALGRLRAATPPALAPYAAGYVERKAPALEAWLDRSSWDALAYGEGLAPAALDAAIGQVAARGTLTYLRGTKEKKVDLGRCLVGWSCSAASDDAVALSLETRATESASLRPALLVDAALKEPALAGATLGHLKVRRMSQRHEAPDGGLVEPFGDGVARASLG